MTVIMMQQDYQYTVILEHNEAGGYTVTVPALPGVVTEGKDFDDAQAMAKDAIRCHLESLALDGEDLPREGELAQVRLSVQIPANA